MIEIPSNKDLTFETERLLVAPMFEIDADALFELLQQPELYVFTSLPAPVSVEGLRTRIHLWEDRLSPQRDELWLNWTLRLKFTGVVIGFVQATVTAHEAELAWLVGVPYQGQGYATEACRCLIGWLRDQRKVQKVRANIHRKHAISQRLAQNLGLSRSGDLTNEGEEVWMASYY